MFREETDVLGLFNEQCSFQSEGFSFGFPGFVRFLKMVFDHLILYIYLYYIYIYIYIYILHSNKGINCILIG